MTTPEPRIDAAGPQPSIDYLTKDYEGFKQGMLNQIPLLLPGWTDRGESDFGVVLIELFAYVADILSYYQDRVANEAFLSTATQRRSVSELLRLIGYQMDPGLAASTFLHLDVTADVVQVTPPYQVRTAGRPGEPDVAFEVTHEVALHRVNNAIRLVDTDTLPSGSTAVTLTPADHALTEGDAVYLEQRTPVPGGTDAVRRSPMLIVSRIRRLPDGRDEVSWLPALPEPMQPDRTVLKGNNTAATHGRTVTDEPEHVSDGTPGQRLSLSRPGVTHLLRDGEAQRRKSGPELQVRVDDVGWQQVESLSASGPTDQHYVTEVDEDDVLDVVFGTGLRGAVPAAGASIRTSYRVGSGSVGNVGPDSLTVATGLAAVSAVSNPFPATGGTERESTDEARISGPGSVVAQERAVTLADYELLALGVAGVGKARARVGLRGGYKAVQVFIAPENPTTVPPARADAQLRETVQRHLESRMPVNRMAGVDVLDPVHVAVDVAVDVHLRAEASQARAVSEVRQVLQGLLSYPAQEFGRPVRVGDVFSALYPLAGVDYVRLRRLQRRDRPAPGGDCEFVDVPIADHELAYEGSVVVSPFGGVR